MVVRVLSAENDVLSSVFAPDQRAPYCSLEYEYTVICWSALRYGDTALCCKDEIF